MTDNTHYGPKTAVGQYVFGTKYAQQGETPRDVYGRVASALCFGHEHYHKFRDLLASQKFLPGGRIMAGAGASRAVTLYNCFVSGIISDSFVDGYGSIMDRAKEAAVTMRMGGGIGYDFSTLRPRGSLIKKLGSTASGPVSFMEIFNAVCLATCSAGHRRGAQMGVLRVDHPDIWEFIHAKTKPGALEGFNISVAITDDFMQAVGRQADFPLHFQGDVYQTVKAAELWEAIMRAAWDWAEPGVVFIDKMNADNNLHYCEEITATNPCSEQPLPPHGACLLGSFNLTQYMKTNGVGQWHFDFAQFEQDIPVAVEALDRVVEASQYPLSHQREEAFDKRRMGIGVTGLANAIEAMQINRTGDYSYGSAGFLHVMHAILGSLSNGAYQASARLAQRLGSFPAFDKDQYLESKFLRRLSPETVETIKAHGIRNSHLISIAPTGTISLCADNVSSGVEPTFAVETDILAHMPDGEKRLRVRDYGVENFGTDPKTSSQVTAREHIDVLACAQNYCDSAVSKTCNVDGTMAWEDFKDIYARAYRMGAKGCSVFNKDGKRMAALVEAPSEVAVEQRNCVTGTCDI